METGHYINMDRESFEILELASIEPQFCLLCGVELEAFEIQLCDDCNE